MPWTPTFWIKKEDLNKVIADFHGKFSAYRFDIAGQDGVAIYGSAETTKPNTDLDDFFNVFGIDHWVIDGEGPGCEKCHVWGEQLYHGEG